MGGCMKDNTLPKIKQATDEIWIQVARTLMAIMEQRDELLNLHCVRVANNCANFCERFLSEGWLDRIDKSSIRQMFKEILTNFKAGKIDAPVMPQVVKEVQSMIKQSMSSVDDVAGIVEKDPVMSLRLIAVANSPVYRGVQQIESLKHAIPRIGLKETYNIIFAISVKSLYETKRVHFRNLMDELWQHALA